MAINVETLLQFSPNRGSLAISCAGGAGSGTVTNAELLAAFAAGTPLGDLVRLPVANLAAAQAAMLGGNVVSSAPSGRIYMAAQLTGSPAAAPAIAPIEAAGAIALQLEAGADGAWLFYIENVHSLAR